MREFSFSKEIIVKAIGIFVRKNEKEEDKDTEHHCGECGAEVSVDDRFCPKCGVKIDDTDITYSLEFENDQKGE